MEIASGIGRKMGGKIRDFYGFLKKLGEDRPPKDLTWDLRWRLLPRLAGADIRQVVKLRPVPVFWKAQGKNPVLIGSRDDTKHPVPISIYSW